MPVEIIFNEIRQAEALFFMAYSHGDKDTLKHLETWMKWMSELYGKLAKVSPAPRNDIPRIGDPAPTVLP